MSNLDESNSSQTGDFEIMLRRRLGNRIRDLQVRVEKSGITLRGSTNSFYAKQIAQQVFMEFAGFPIRANEIEVEKPPSVLCKLQSRASGI